MLKLSTFINKRKKTQIITGYPWCCFLANSNLRTNTKWTKSPLTFLAVAGY